MTDSCTSGKKKVSGTYEKPRCAPKTPYDFTENNRAWNECKLCILYFIAYMPNSTSFDFEICTVHIHSFLPNYMYWKVIFCQTGEKSKIHIVFVSYVQPLLSSMLIFTVCVSQHMLLLQHFIQQNRNRGTNKCTKCEVQPEGFDRNNSRATSSLQHLIQ